MEKLSGLILDPYDDAEGSVLRSVFPSEADVPDLIKQAHFVTPEERAALPSDVFALELIDGPVVLRKYACVDAGNTALSIEYFLKTAHKLPEAAQKTAAQNLLTACEWYDIEPPEKLQKLAGVGGMLNKAMIAASAPAVLKDTSKQIQRNRALAGASGSAVNPETLMIESPRKFGQ